MKLFRTIRRGYVYQPYLREEDVMVDPRDQNFMPYKRDMIFIRKKGNQPTPSSVVLEEAKDEEIGEEEAHFVSRSEQLGEASTNRGRQSKHDVLLNEFEDFKAQTTSNFEAIKQKLQANQAENASKFGILVQKLEALQAEIQLMRR